MNLTDGILRLRYAEDPSQPRLRQPGEVVRVRITLFPTANLFLPGHRIRLDVSSSNFPKFDVNPNTGEPEGLARRRRMAVNTVFVDAAGRAGWCCRCWAFSPGPASIARDSRAGTQQQTRPQSASHQRGRKIVSARWSPLPSNGTSLRLICLALAVS